jgi:prevent-host-death family protein
MKGPSMAPDLVGVRELRQNLSVYLERVIAGETLRVTDRGREVALLVPLGAPARAIDRLIASGRSSRPRLHLLSLGRPGGRVTRSVSAALEETRDDRS